jgi:uncharacterized protein (DUF4213/DUF364 family)
MLFPFVDDSISLESIVFQDTLFFKELVAAFKPIKNMPQRIILTSDIGARLSSIIEHHTKMNVTVHFSEEDAGVDVPMVNRNNVLINSFIKNSVNSSDGMKMIGEARNAVRGSVDLIHGKVTGIFTEVHSTINLPMIMLISPRFESEEIAATLFHEVGHLLSYFEYMTRSVTTNQALAGLSKALDGSGNVAEREAVLIYLKKALRLTELDAKELAKTTDNKVAEIVVISNLAEQSVSEIGSNIYDFNSWEYLADQYVARQGAGRYLVTALDKIYRGQSNMAFRSLPAYLSMEATKALLMISGAGMWAVPGLSKLGRGFMDLSSMMVAFDGNGDGTYDRPGARFKRVRNQIVENLKDRNLDRDTQTRLKDDIVAIDGILEQMTERHQVTDALWELFSPRARANSNQVKLQRQLEDLAANDLFLQSATLNALV